MTRCILAQMFAFYCVNIPPVAVLRKAQQGAGRGAGDTRPKEAPGLQSDMSNIFYIKHAYIKYYYS